MSCRPDRIQPGELNEITEQGSILAPDQEDVWPQEVLPGKHQTFLQGFEGRSNVTGGGLTVGWLVLSPPGEEVSK
jgi:hypothetical protein